MCLKAQTSFPVASQGLEIAAQFPQHILKLTVYGMCCTSFAPLHILVDCEYLSLQNVIHTSAEQAGIAKIYIGHKKIASLASA